MRTVVFSLGVAAAALAAPAMARDGEVYLGADVGVVFPDDFDTDIDGALDAATTENREGWELAGILGYDFGFIRTELEGSYKEWDPEQITLGTSGIPLFNGVFGQPGTVIRNGSYPYGGEFRLTSVMANALLDFGGNEGIGLSVGVGGGRTYLGADTTASNSGPGYLDDEDNAWAWQGIAQARMPVTDSIDLGLKYKYFKTQEFQLTDTVGRVNEFDIATHSAILSLLINFGGDEPMAVITPPPPPLPATPPPPPPPPAPPAPPVQQCNTGPYIVFFDWDRSDITPEAATVLNSAVTSYRDCGTARVMLAGHADRSGSTQYNVGLSERRNAAVRDYMTGRGVPAARINSQAFGESQPRVATADGVRELQNRRVEVTYGPGSGN
ncbi:OmpA family protein [Erythrobacter arachoides]|uniref:OmpA family protein n=1 Tax=Aurantiacibacter arachoides TaxID=1850444 RepID=A0A845A1V8_9SPHN|nr:OmpA family protein [Aurantiacibacter arachoides]MXO94533.1 OmpA family protein [Aurantiacibacter arachoides]